ncbi:MAG: bifunctional DNA-formamidopyrimidine glycosylase/DNA-(apurinic or apyrimidinic site) lyase [Bdellovibrionaceae bacterium]|nr:bifunctional DNA-formamidopyrimidine glycosylase/DNA-(apurinic or apyrimidinic site) lyase [Pseudobdellovibrionaceae bacterium]
MVSEDEVGIPELPEVETVRRDLEALLGPSAVIRRVRLMRPDLRFPIPPTLPRKVARQRVLAVRRRAKYLLIETPAGILLSHLGMTGTWREVRPGERDRHDHVLLELEDGRWFAYRDPRRFGILDWIEPGMESQHKLLRHLGPEPFTDTWNGEYLWRKSRRRLVAIKVFLMDQKIVVGVGNIYASEALFRAGIRPTRAAGRLTRAECDRLTVAVRDLLKESILAGGSTISDFHGAGGADGDFQKTFRVYDREGEPCLQCRAPIRAKTLGGRSTFWCSKCQR